jgi:hypothetical protein
MTSCLKTTEHRLFDDANEAYYRFRMKATSVRDIRWYRSGSWTPGL